MLEYNRNESIFQRPITPEHENHGALAHNSYPGAEPSPGRLSLDAQAECAVNDVRVALPRPILVRKRPATLRRHIAKTPIARSATSIFNFADARKSIRFSCLVFIIVELRCHEVGRYLSRNITAVDFIVWNRAQVVPGRAIIGL
jgi:hypothetical protein